MCSAYVSWVRNGIRGNLKMPNFIFSVQKKCHTCREYPSQGGQLKGFTLLLYF
jgi:hypothetical protein